MPRKPIYEQLEESDAGLIVELLKSGLTIKEVAVKFDTHPAVVYRFLSDLKININKLEATNSISVSDFKTCMSLHTTEPLILTHRRKPKYIIVPYEEYKEKLL